MKLARLILLASASMSSMATAQSAAQPAVPDNAPTIVAGSATFSTDTAGTVRTITQTTDRAFLDWSTLNVPQDHTLRFNQPDANAITLNRVTGGSSSVIDGLIEANGQVWILNPNGVFISPTGQVTTQGFLASTGNIAHTDFMAATTQFAVGNTGSAASIINQGTITSSLGYTVLNAATVRNSGTITAERGKVLLASVDDLSISFDQGQLISYALSNGSSISSPTREITNTGTITANGGLIALSMASALGTISGVINVEGLIEAKSVGSSKGAVTLDAGPNGALTVKGTVSVEGTQTGEIGGDITLRGGLVTVGASAGASTALAALSADGKAGGGTILLEAKPAAQTAIDYSTFQFSNSTTTTVSQPALPQREELNNGSLASVAIKQGSMLSASARESGAGGLITVNGNGELGLATKIAGQLRANGAGLTGRGGAIDLSGFYLDIDGATLEAIGGTSFAVPGTVKLTAASIDLVEQLTPAASDVLAWQSSASLPFYDPAVLQSLDIRDLQVAEAVPIGFDFLYFGETFDSLEVSYAGFAAFGRLNGNSLCCNGVPLDTIRTPPAIFGLWTDLGIEVDVGSNVIKVPSGKPLFGTFNLPDGSKEFVLQWPNVPEFFNRGTGNTFEIRIRDSGAIIFNYGALDVVNHSVTAGLIGRTITDTAQLFFRGVNQANTLADIFQTSSIFRQPDPTSQFRAGDIGRILDSGTSVSINAKEFTADNKTNLNIGNVTVSTASSIDLSQGGPKRQVIVTADKTIVIKETQDFGLNGFDLILRADSNRDSLGHIQSFADIVGTDLIDIDGLLIVSAPIQLGSSGDINLSAGIILEDVPGFRMDAGGAIAITGSVSGSAGEVVLNASNGMSISGDVTLSSQGTNNPPPVMLLNSLGELSIGGQIVSENAAVVLRGTTINAGPILLGSVGTNNTGTIDIDVSQTGLLTGPVTASSLFKNGLGTVTLAGGAMNLTTISLAAGTLKTDDASRITSSTNLLFANGNLEFTGASAVTLNNPVFVQQSGEISFAGSGTIAGPIISLSDGIGNLSVKAVGDLTFAGEIGANQQRLSNLSAIAGGRITLGSAAKLAASDVIELAGFSGFTNLSSSADVLTSAEWFIWSGNPDPFGGSTPDITGALAHDWRFYGISEAMVRGDALPPARPIGANGLGYSLAPMLTPKMVSNLSKVYDGTQVFPTTQVGLNFAGLVNGDTQSNVSIASILSDVAGISALQATLTGIAASFTDASGKPVFGYQFSPTITSPVSILPRPLLAALVGSVSRNYDGTTNALLTSGNFALDGLVLGETITVTQTAGSFATPNVGNDLSISTSLASANFTAGAGTALSNYLLPSNAAGAIGSILPLFLVYRANPAVRFLGAANPAFTGSVTGFLQGETLATATTGALIFTSLASIESDLGLYPIIGSGLIAINYIFAQAPENATALTIQPNIVNQISNVNAQSQGSAAGASSGSGAASGSGSGSGSGSNSGSGSDSDSGSGSDLGSDNDSDPGRDSGTAADADSGSDPDDSSSSDSSETSDEGSTGGSSEGATSSGTTDADTGGTEAPDAGGDSASTDQQSSQASPTTIVAVDAEAADPLPPSPVGEEPTSTPSDPEDSSDPVLAAVLADDDTQPQITNTQQDIVALTPSISISPQQQTRPEARTQDSALSINVSLMP